MHDGHIQSTADLHSCGKGKKLAAGVTEKEIASRLDTTDSFRMVGAGMEGSEGRTREL